MLEPARAGGIPAEWGMRRITAMQLAIQRQCVCVVLSEETGHLSIFTNELRTLRTMLPPLAD